MPEELASVKVMRFDPGVDQSPRYEDYQAPYVGLSVLQVLRYIYENFAPTLAYRFGCTGPNEVRCGACILMVNSRPALSCQKAAEKEMVIEPHPDFEVIKDLVTDLNRKKKVTRRKVAVELRVDPEKCIACGDCVLMCPSKVWRLKKVDGKTVAVPEEIESCCGLTCRQCTLFCQSRAITLTAK